MGKVADDAPSGNTERRRYDASGRRERAAASRRRIVDAAADLFGEQGYAATTLDQIAARAGVTAKLVAANGPKRALLLAAFEQRFAGAESPDPGEVPEAARGFLARTDPQGFLEGLADYVLEGQERGIGMWRALSAASDQDPEIHATYLRVARGRHEAIGLGLRLLDERGMLRPGDRERQTATLALLMGFDPYQLMVLDWGWPRERLRQWFLDTIAATLVRLPE